MATVRLARCDVEQESIDFGENVEFIGMMSKTPGVAATQQNKIIKRCFK